MDTPNIIQLKRLKRLKCKILTMLRAIKIIEQLKVVFIKTRRHTNNTYYFEHWTTKQSMEY